MIEGMVCDLMTYRYRHIHALKIANSIKHAVFSKDFGVSLTSTTEFGIIKQYYSHWNRVKINDIGSAECPI